MIDETIYLIFWNLILALGFHMNIRQTGWRFVVIGIIYSPFYLFWQNRLAFKIWYDTRENFCLAFGCRQKVVHGLHGGRLMTEQGLF